MVAVEPREQTLRRVLLCGGGTGGHLVPGLAIEELLRRRSPGCRVTLVCSGRQVERQVSKGARIDAVVMDMAPPGGGIRGGFRFARDVWREVAALRRRMQGDPVDVVVGLGGYASIPGILAARLEGVPLVLLEQNARPGKVNRLLGVLAACVACSAPESTGGFGPLGPLMRLETTGNPLRDSVLQARRWRGCRSPEERRRDVGAGERRVLLVVGGSQGARALNRAVIAALPALEDFFGKTHFIHVAGNADKEEVESAYRRAGCEAVVVAYDPALPDLLAGADLVLARAGGTSISEFAAIGVPSVLVPYPGHRDRHQLMNARTLSDRGAALLLEERSLEGAGLQTVLECLFDDARLLEMERAATACARTDGAERVVGLMEAAAAGPS